ESMYQRFISARRDIPHEVLQSFVAVDYTTRMMIVASLQRDGKETICGIGQYSQNSDVYTADIALVVRDDFQNQGIGGELLSYLTYIAKRQGLLGFTAEVLMGNEPVFRLFQSTGFDVTKESQSGVCEMRAMFR
ncbi:MAG: GNAT family N-acetyltransferase, partial [Methanothrix sp.]|nr:GNAT family N-acetyltransferase [Methanothrix sp.]